MPATWFIGDPHFNHEKVSLIRGFETTQAHNRAIIKPWLRQVSDQDTVICMGDISGGGREGERLALETLRLLPGRKMLVGGNHDGVSGVHTSMSPNRELFKEVFETINDFRWLKFEGRQILMSHFPYIESGDGPGRGPARYEQFRLPNLGKPLIHAHTHHTHPTDGSKTGLELCVSWDAWRRMVGMGDVAQWVRSLAIAD